MSVRLWNTSYFQDRSVGFVGVGHKSVWLVTNRNIERGIRQTIVAVFVIGIRRRNPGAVVNSVFALLGTYLPSAAERWFDVEFRPWQRGYVGVAMVTHAVGMLGPYDSIGWWDHLTHTLSASILGGFVFTAAKRRGRDPQPRVLGAVVGGGLLWELIEYLIHAVANRLGIEPILVVYSAKDTILDLFFNLVGALLVLVFGEHLLRNLVQSDDR